MAFLDNWTSILILVSALGTGLMAGLFFIFSVCVMKALSRLPSSEGIVVMQHINETIINPFFGILFFGTALACAISVIVALLHLQNPGALYTLVGGTCYLTGSLLVTFVFNIPRNNALAKVDAQTTESATFWNEFLSTWTAWNHVRTLSSTAAAVAFIISAGYHW